MKNKIDTTLDKCLIIKQSNDHAISYSEYRKLVEDHVEKGTSTSPIQTEALTQFTLLNHSRMNRLDKTIKVADPVKEKFQNYDGRQIWLVIAESWCGDAAQVLPVINKLAELTAGIDLKIVLRDEHPELMGAFLTNGSRSIPKLIACDLGINEVIHEWGPRPREATQMVRDFISEFGSLTPEFKRDLQVWYNKDKGQSTIEELAGLL